MSTIQQIVKEIDAFLADTGMAETYFGALAVKNPNLISRVRAGGDMNSRTIDRVREFIASERIRREEKASAA
jgi:hypothetical protein